MDFMKIFDGITSIVVFAFVLLRHLFPNHPYWESSIDGVVSIIVVCCIAISVIHKMYLHFKNKQRG